MTIKNNEVEGGLEAVTKLLKAEGIKLTVAPGEYIVNFSNGSPATEYRTDDLGDALRHGILMGPPPETLPPLGPMGKGRASQRARMYAHNRKVAARRRKQQDDKT